MMFGIRQTLLEDLQILMNGGIVPNIQPTEEERFVDAVYKALPWWRKVAYNAKRTLREIYREAERWGFTP